MKKFFAILLAVLMTASLSVVGMAGIVFTDTTLYLHVDTVIERRDPVNGYILSWNIIPNETAENSGVGAVEWTAPKFELDISADEMVKEGFLITVANDEYSMSILGGEGKWEIVKVNSFTSENGVFKFKKIPNEWGNYECNVKLAQPLTEVGTFEDTIVVTTPKAMYKEMNDVADKGDGPFTYKFPIAITVTGDIPTGGGSTGGGSSDDHDTPPATENAANDDKTLDKLAAGESAEVKLTSGSAALATDTMDTLGSHGGKLTVTVDKMTVANPGGFGKVNEPGRIYYPLDFSDSLATAADLAAAVKGEKAKTEVVKAGGDMVMPTTVTVTLKTKLTGTVNVYHYNDTTRRYTLLASPAAKDGKITFATKQMGTMVLTTGTI